MMVKNKFYTVDIYDRRLIKKSEDGYKTKLEALEAEERNLEWELLEGQETIYTAEEGLVRVRKAIKRLKTQQPKKLKK